MYQLKINNMTVSKKTNQLSVNEAHSAVPVTDGRTRWWLLALAFLGVAADPLCAEIPLGDYGALAIDTEAGVEYSSNIALNSLEQEDTVFNVMPLLRYRSDKGQMRFEAYAGVNVIRYDKYDENDAEDLKSQIVLEFPDGAGRYDKRYDMRVELGYNEDTSANSSVQAIASVNKTNFDAIGRYYYSDRSYFRSGILYLNRDSARAGFYDVYEVSVPMEVFYEYTESLSYGLGYRFRMTDIDSPAPESDSTDHAVYFAAVGEFDPSVTGEIRAGLQWREFDSSAYDSESNIFVESSLLWQISDLTWMKISLGNEFGTTILNESKETLFARFKLHHSFTEQWDGVVGFGYDDIDYQQNAGSRNDDQWLVELGAIYTLIEDRLSLEGYFSYRNRDSTESYADYDVSRMRLSISYLF